MKTHTKTLLTAFACTAGLTLSASGATIVDYNFDSDTSNTATELNYSTTPFAATGTVFDASGRSTSGTSENFFTRNGETSLTGDNYVGFTVTVDPGFELDLVSFSFQFDNQDAAAGVLSDDFTSTYSVRTSVDGFTSDLSGTYNGNPLSADSSVDFGSSKSGSFDLTGSAFQNLTGTFEMRIYAEVTFAGNEHINRYDSVVLEGEVVPEPGSLALLGLGGLLIARRRRG